MSSGAGAGAGAGATEGGATLEVPTVVVNPAGWGPTALPERYAHVPYAPFAKSDKLGRVADITGFTKNWHRAFGVYARRRLSTAMHAAERATPRARASPCATMRSVSFPAVAQHADTMYFHTAW